MPNRRTSKRRASESASSAYLVIEYAPEPGVATNPAAEPRFTMRPDRWARMPGRTSRHIRTTPKTLVSNCRWRSDIASSSTGPPRE